MYPMYPTEVIQLIMIPICTWVVYKAGYHSGIKDLLTDMVDKGIIELVDDEEAEEEDS